MTAATLLLGLSALFVVGLEAIHMPAALLLGPVVAAILPASRGRAVSIPGPVFLAAQALVGCMIATKLPLSLFGEVTAHWPMFLAGIGSTLIASLALGAVLARFGVLPGTTAIWGVMPGAATVMTLMSASYGADMQLVAFSQYFPVACVATVSSAVSRLWAAGAGSAVATPAWFAPLPLLPIAETLLLSGLGVLAGIRLRIPGGPLLVPMFIGMVLGDSGVMTIVIPPWLLAIAYAVLCWGIGMRFTPLVLRNAAHAFPGILASIVSLIALGGLFAYGLQRFDGIAPLTAYLATSPGGADTVAIIAASSPVDVPFVMTMQMGRFLLVLLAGPALARLVAKAVQGRTGSLRFSGPR